MLSRFDPFLLGDIKCVLALATRGEAYKVDLGLTPLVGPVTVPIYLDLIGDTVTSILDLSGHRGVIDIHYGRGSRSSRSWIV